MIVIFSGYNQRAVIAFIRTLEKNKIENYCILAASNEDTILRTAYKSKVGYIRKNKQLDLNEIIEAIDSLNKAKEKVLIAPSTEALNRFLLDNREALEQAGCIVPLVNKELYERISDKESFFAICKEAGLRVPVISSDTSDKWPLPFVAKPKRYTASDGRQYAPVIVYTENEKADFLRNYNSKDFDIQEFVSGRSLYLFYYFAEKGEVLRFSQENMCQQPGGKSILLARPSDIHRLKVADDYEALFKDLGYRGLVMVEVRKSAQDYYMIEANPRFWGPSQLCVDAGVNFFEAFLKDYGYLIKEDNAYNPEARYMWLGGFKGEPEADDSCVWHPDGKDIYLREEKDFLAYDIYGRDDTRNI